MKVSSKVHQLKHTFEIPISQENRIKRFVNFFIIEGEKLYLIDTGTKTSVKLLTTYLEQIGRTIDEVSAIFLTHSHPDHIGSLAELSSKKSFQVYAHASEKSWIENVDLQFKERPVPGFFELVAGSSIVNFCYSDGEVINVEPDIHLTPVFTPGHSDGSICLYFNEEKILFTGDAILLSGELPIYTNFKSYLNSLEKIQAFPDVNKYLSAWDEARNQHEIKTILEQSINYISVIAKAVKACSSLYSNNNQMEFCNAVVAKLGMPPFLANHLLLKSFESHLIHIE